MQVRQYTNTVRVNHNGAGKTIHKHGAGINKSGTTYHKLFGSFIAPLFVTGPHTAQQPEINSI